MQQRGMAKLLRLRMTLLTISLALAASWWCGGRLGKRDGDRRTGQQHRDSHHGD
jgi:hypothetical protein